MELAVGLSDDHIEAIQATGISDVGKATLTQTGTGRNSARVQALAAEAKSVLGGYFREFTFAIREQDGWDHCDCGSPPVAGLVIDPFAGTGTTGRVADRLGFRSWVGDLAWTAHADHARLPPPDHR